jgi:hypothetical protein
MNSQLDKLEFLLASLAYNSLFIEEKFKVIEDIRKLYIRLDKEDKNSINLWLNGRYKKFLELLIRYNNNIHDRISFVNASFRWGISGVIYQDVEFANYLIESIFEKKIFKDEVISSYAYLTYGTILFHYFREVKDEIEKEFYFNKASKSLSNSYYKATNGYLKNRSSYFLSQLCSLNSDFSTALIWYFKSLDSTNLVHDQFSIFYSILFRTVNFEMVNHFNNINKIFTKENFNNRYFWIYIKSKLDNPILIENINRVINLCDMEKSPKVSSWSNEIEEFVEILNIYLNNMLPSTEISSIGELQKLYFSPILNHKGKAEVIFRMAESLKFYSQDFSRAILMASESNSLFFKDKRLMFMSNIILKNFSHDIRMILDNSSYKFKNYAIYAYFNEKDKKVVAWKRFVNRGCLSGRFDEEVEFLEYIKKYSKNIELIKVLKTRLAYLYFTGKGGVTEDGFETPNYYKAREYFRELKDNSLVRKYLKHPKLSIYLDIEKTTPHGGNYLFFEKKFNNRLLIIFSCAFSYTHYTQLREFYQRNKINVLFINNPLLNWYHGTEWTRVESIMREVVFPNFKKENITTYFGSMGGYGALRVSLTYNIKSIVFNPQIDLDLWIKHRSIISTRLNREKLLHIQNFSISSFEKTPIYLATSSSIEDVEAFKIFVNKISLCRNGLFIIEKIKDNVHAGIFAKIYKQNQQDIILNISKLQDRYFPSFNHTKIKYSIPLELNHKFWNFLIRSMELRVIIQIFNGELLVAGVKENFSKEPKLYSLNIL